MTTDPSRRPPDRRRHYLPPKHLVRRDQGDARLAPRRALPMDGRARGEASTELTRPRLIGSAAGSIAALLMTIPAGSARAADLAPVYRELLSSLPGTTRFFILTHRSVRDVVEAWPEAMAVRERITLLPVEDHLHFTDWAQDPYVIVDSNEGRAFIEPLQYLRNGDALLAERLAPHAGLLTTQAPLYFQGGNFLVGDDFFLLGADYPRRTKNYIPDVLLPADGETDEALVERLFQSTFDSERRFIQVASPVTVPSATYVLREDDAGFWVEEHYIGNEPGTVQPLFHIDMFISLAGRGDDGRYRLLVGDPGLAARILGREPSPYSMQEVFDGVAAELEALGFAVCRNPLPLVYWVEDVARDYFRSRDPETFRVLEERNVDQVPLYHWFFATANNALVQDLASDRRVWLPTYAHGDWTSLAATDAANAELWAKLGFTPHLLGDFLPFADRLGAVHCITKYLERSTNG